MSDKREQVAAQCRAVAHMAQALAEVHRVTMLSISSPATLDSHVEQVGKRTAIFMEVLGDMLNGMDAVDESDEWLTPVFEEANRLWHST